MTNGQRAIATLLAVVVLLLVINILTNVPGQEAAAQAQMQPHLPRVVAISTDTMPGGEFSRVFRLWSDGSIDTTRVIFETLPENVPGCEVLDTCTQEVVVIQ